MQLWILLFALFGGAVSLRLLSLEVPENVTRGKDVTLSCNYDLEGDPMYAIKWYKDDVEFFRYLPRDGRSKEFFRLEGVEVDLEKSSDTSIYLRKVSDQTAGRYRCEVSAAEPSFQTIEEEKYMAVVPETEVRLIQESNSTHDLYSYGSTS